MERGFDELRTYVDNLDTYLEKLGKIPLSSDKATQEMFRSVKLVNNYLKDTVDSLEDKFKEQEAKINDLAQDNQRYSQRSVAMVNDIRGMAQKIEELEGVKEQVDKLTNILLKSLKDLPVKGADRVDEPEEVEKPFRSEFYIQDYKSQGEDFTLPDTFEGRVTLNGLEMTEKGGDISIMLSPGFQVYRVFGPLHEGDKIVFAGKVTEKEE
jgi:seryl-tRNA synthetase